MGDGMRRGLGRVIPWLALVLVSIFAFTQVRAHRDARGELVRLKDDHKVLEQRRHLRLPQRSSPPVPVPAPAPGVTDRERELDEALTGEREARAATAARLAASEEALRRERERADRREALRATEAARARAAAARARDSEAQADELEQDLETARSDLEKAAATPVERWLADAASGDKARVEYARACAKGAKPEEVDELRSLFGVKPDHEPAFVRLASALAASDDASALAVDLLLACSDAAFLPDRVDVLGNPHLLRPAALERILSQGEPNLGRAAVRWVADHWSKLDADGQSGMATLLREKLASRESEVSIVAARGVALAKLPDAGPQLVSLLNSVFPEVRAAAAHALSRIPDLDRSKDRVKPHLLPLLTDVDRAVRTAGVLLTEKVVGERIDFDPGASAKERAEALERLRARLGE